MKDRLRIMDERYEELNRLLMDPEIVCDVKKLTTYSKEQRSLEKAVVLYRELKKLEDEADKFAAELRTGMHYTNDGKYKPDKDGEIGLTNEQRAYRSGYLDARKDSAKIHKYKERKGYI